MSPQSPTVLFLMRCSFFNGIQGSLQKNMREKTKLAMNFHDTNVLQNSLQATKSPSHLFRFSSLALSSSQLVGAKLKVISYSDDLDHLTCVCNLSLYKMDLSHFEHVVHKRSHKCGCGLWNF